MHKKVKSLEWEYTDKKVTAWGGFRLLEEFLRKIQIEETLRDANLPQPKSNAGYQPEQILIAFLLTVWIGGNRFAHTAYIRFDEVVREMFGWNRIPSASTFCRFFGRFKQNDVNQCFYKINRWIWDHIAPIKLTLDLDSTVFQHNGEKMEGVAKGYNPLRPGRKSHHPLLAFAADLRMVVHGWLRAGNTAAHSNVIGFMEETLAILGTRHKVGLLRADSGFFVGSFFDWLEEKSIDYIIAGRMSNILRGRIGSITNWQPVDKGIEVSEIEWKCESWSKVRRMIVVRQCLSDRPKAAGKLLLEIPGYRHSVLLTSFTNLPPVEIWRLYRGRADCENRIKELKSDFGMEGFSVRSFWGSEAAMRSVILGYNLMSIFRYTALGASNRETLQTLRFKCFAIGSLLGNEAGKKKLRMNVALQNRKWIDGLFSKLDDFDLLFWSELKT